MVEESKFKGRFGDRWREYMVLERQLKEHFGDKWCRKGAGFKQVLDAIRQNGIWTMLLPQFRADDELDYDKNAGDQEARKEAIRRDLESEREKNKSSVYIGRGSQPVACYAWATKQLGIDELYADALQQLIDTLAKLRSAVLIKCDSGSQEKVGMVPYDTDIFGHVDELPDFMPPGGIMYSRQLRNILSEGVKKNRPVNPFRLAGHFNKHSDLCNCGVVTGADDATWGTMLREDSLGFSRISLKYEPDESSVECEPKSSKDCTMIRAEGAERDSSIYDKRIRDAFASAEWVHLKGSITHRPIWVQSVFPLVPGGHPLKSYHSSTRVDSNESDCHRWTVVLKGSPGLPENNKSCVKKSTEDHTLVKKSTEDHTLWSHRISSQSQQENDSLTVLFTRADQVTTEFSETIVEKLSVITALNMRFTLQHGLEGRDRALIEGIEDERFKLVERNEKAKRVYWSQSSEDSVDDDSLAECIDAKNAVKEFETCVDDAFYLIEYMEAYHMSIVLLREQYGERLPGENCIKDAYENKYYELLKKFTNWRQNETAVQASAVLAIFFAESLRAVAGIHALFKHKASVTPEPVAIEVFRVLTCLALLPLRFRLEKNLISVATCILLALIICVQMAQITSRPQPHWKDPNLKLALEATTTFTELLAVLLAIFPGSCSKSYSFSKKLPTLAVSIAGFISLFIPVIELVAGGPSETDSILRAGAASITTGAASTLIFSRTRKSTGPLGSLDENCSGENDRDSRGFNRFLPSGDDL